MVEGGRGPSFPVVFFDGEREMNIGDIQINPTLEYKPFQHMLSHKIGISPNQISIYLVDRKKTPKAPFSEDRRRIPITGKVNFGLICGQRDCCFLVVLKRSRKSRYRRERAFSDFLSEGDFSPSPMPMNMVLLRRNQQDPFYDEIAQSELADLNDRLQSLRIQRENYQMTMGKGNPIVDAVPDWPGVTPAKNSQTRKAFCGECEDEERNASTASFHPCVNDAVITARFPSPAGPISRPYRPVQS